MGSLVIDQSASSSRIELPTPTVAPWAIADGGASYSFHNQRALRHFGQIAARKTGACHPPARPKRPGAPPACLCALPRPGRRRSCPEPGPQAQVDDLNLFGPAIAVAALMFEVIGSTSRARIFGVKPVARPECPPRALTGVSISANAIRRGPPRPLRRHKVGWR